MVTETDWALAPTHFLRCLGVRTIIGMLPRTLQLGVDGRFSRCAINLIRKLDAYTGQALAVLPPAACDPEKVESKSIPGGHMALHGISL